jgi:hypothetical protein
MGRVQTWLSFQTGAGRIERRPVARDICSGPDELALQRLSRIMSASWGPRHSEQDEVQRRAEATASKLGLNGAMEADGADGEEAEASD